MRKLLAVGVAIAALVAPTSALADPGWRGRGNWRSEWNRDSHWGQRGHWGHHRWHSGPRLVLGYGAPYWWGPPAYGYGYGWGWGPPVVIRDRGVEREPPEYIERDGEDEAPYEAEADDGSWYFCRSENAYYPDVERCPEAWIPVPPRSE